MIISTPSRKNKFSILLDRSLDYEQLKEDIESIEDKDEFNLRLGVDCNRGYTVEIKKREIVSNKYIEVRETNDRNVCCEVFFEGEGNSSLSITTNYNYYDRCLITQQSICHCIMKKYGNLLICRYSDFSDYSALAIKLFRFDNKKNSLKNVFEDAVYDLSNF